MFINVFTSKLEGKQHRILPENGFRKEKYNLEINNPSQ